MAAALLRAVLTLIMGTGCTLVSFQFLLIHCIGIYDGIFLHNTRPNYFTFTFAAHNGRQRDSVALSVLLLLLRRSRS